MKSVVPDNNFEFVEIVKIFVNLLFALFSSACPHYLQVKKILAVLHYYKRSALQALTRSTHVLILWIILLQTHHFVLVKITELVEFKIMMKKLTSKDGYIPHAEVSIQLLHNIKNQPLPSNQDNYPNTLIPRFTHEPDPSPSSIKAHSLLKKNIVDNILCVSNGFSVTVICKYSNTVVKALCSDPKRCTLGMVGMYRNWNCTRKHNIATDQEAIHIMNLL